MATRTASIRLAEETLARLDHLAEAMDRSRSWIVNHAIDQYLDYEEWFSTAVEEGRAAADNGQILSHETVVRKWEQKLAASLDKSR